MPICADLCRFLPIFTNFVCIHAVALHQNSVIIPTDVDRAGVCADVDRGACRCRETEGGRGGRGAGRRGSQVGVGEQRPHPRAVAEPAAAAQQAQEEAQETGGEGGEERTQGERAQRRAARYWGQIRIIIIMSSKWSLD